MTSSAGSKLKSYEVAAVIIRADGSRVELGTIAYHHRNPLRRVAFRAKQIIQGVKRWLPFLQTPVGRS
jgi:hypothetical protein